MTTPCKEESKADEQLQMKNFFIIKVGTKPFVVDVSVYESWMSIRQARVLYICEDTPNSAWKQFGKLHVRPYDTNPDNAEEYSSEFECAAFSIHRSRVFWYVEMDMFKKAFDEWSEENMIGEASQDIKPEELLSIKEELPEKEAAANKSDAKESPSAAVPAPASVDGKKNEVKITSFLLDMVVKNPFSVYSSRVEVVVYSTHVSIVEEQSRVFPISGTTYRAYGSLLIKSVDSLSGVNLNTVEKFDQLVKSNHMTKFDWEVDLLPFQLKFTEWSAIAVKVPRDKPFDSECLAASFSPHFVSSSHVSIPSSTSSQSTSSSSVPSSVSSSPSPASSTSPPSTASSFTEVTELSSVVKNTFMVHMMIQPTDNPVQAHVQVRIYPTYVSIQREGFQTTPALGSSWSIFNGLLVKSRGKFDQIVTCPASMFNVLARANHHSKFKWHESLLAFKVEFDKWSSQNVDAPADALPILYEEHIDCVPGKSCKTRSACALTASDLPLLCSTQSTPDVSDPSAPLPTSPEWPAWAINRLRDLLMKIKPLSAKDRSDMHRYRDRVDHLDVIKTMIDYLRTSYVEDIKELNAQISNSVRVKVPTGAISKQVRVLVSKVNEKRSFNLELDNMKDAVSGQYDQANKETKEAYKKLHDDISNENARNNADIIKQRDFIIKIWNSGFGYKCFVCDYLIPLNHHGAFGNKGHCSNCFTKLPSDILYPNYSHLSSTDSPTSSESQASASSSSSSPPSDERAPGNTMPIPPTLPASTRFASAYPVTDDLVYSMLDSFLETPTDDMLRGVQHVKIRGITPSFSSHSTSRRYNSPSLDQLYGIPSSLLRAREPYPSGMGSQMYRSLALSQFAALSDRMRNKADTIVREVLSQVGECMPHLPRHGPSRSVYLHPRAHIPLDQIINPPRRELTPDELAELYASMQ